MDRLFEREERQVSELLRHLFMNELIGRN